MQEPELSQFWYIFRLVIALTYQSYQHGSNIPFKMCKFHKAINPINTRVCQPQIKTKAKYVKHS